VPAYIVHVSPTTTLVLYMLRRELQAARVLLGLLGCGPVYARCWSSVGWLGVGGGAACRFKVVLAGWGWCFGDSRLQHPNWLLGCQTPGGGVRMVTHRMLV
jgi:hypothetical protein